MTARQVTGTLLLAVHLPGCATYYAPSDPLTAAPPAGGYAMVLLANGETLVVAGSESDDGYFIAEVYQVCDRGSFPKEGMRLGGLVCDSQSVETRRIPIDSIVGFAPGEQKVTGTSVAVWTAATVGTVAALGVLGVAWYAILAMLRNP